MKLKERDLDEYQEYPDLIAGMNLDLEIEERFEEWLSEDKNTLVTLTVFGDHSWYNVWLREVSLYAKTEGQWRELMKVRYAKALDSENIDETVIVGEQVAYSAETGGVKEVLGSCSDEYPERIDVEETARIFIEQLQARVFLTPFLVKKGQ